MVVRYCVRANNHIHHRHKVGGVLPRNFALTHTMLGLSQNETVLVAKRHWLQVFGTAIFTCLRGD